MAEATSTVAFQILMDMLINADEVDKDTLQAIKTLATLERSTVAKEKLKLEYDKGVSAAIDEVKKELQKELENYPELIEKMLNTVDVLRNDLKGGGSD